ncbi:ARM repeat-containing protein, partial [Piedraia hortae CBS 480.64]
EGHAKQRALAKERRAAKPNADSIARSKQIWERLRRKSHVPLDERQKLVGELFTLISGRVSDFVFKHDSVRVVQCALKYANPSQREMIVNELQGSVVPLAESKYGKFLVAKMVVEGNRGIKDTIIPQFYGHVKRLINHAEAGWILDDIYRQVATKDQKTRLLQEWFGAEFAMADSPIGDLSSVLNQSPEKRKPVLSHLHKTISTLVGKQMTGFTMLHDAMWQYYTTLDPASDSHAEFLELLRSDIETAAEGDSSTGGDLLRNLAFTHSGSRLVCHALAHGTAKSRKAILKCYKDAVSIMAYDSNASLVLLTALDVVDDTKLSAKTILADVLAVDGKEADGKEVDSKKVEERLNRREAALTNLSARCVALWPLLAESSSGGSALPETANFLLPPTEREFISSLRAIRSTSSKKDPQTRASELRAYASPLLLELAEKRAAALSLTSFGCRCLAEILLCAQGEKCGAKISVAKLAEGVERAGCQRNRHVDRMFKTLLLGGHFNPATKQVDLVHPRLCFADVFFPAIKGQLVEWTTSPSSFVVVALLESPDVGDVIKAQARKILSKNAKKVEAVKE